MLMKLISLFKNIFVFDEKRAIEDYLAKSVDIYDLEERIRRIDQGKVTFY